MGNEERARFYRFDPATREVSAFGNNVVAWAMAGGGLYDYRTDRVGRLTVATVFYGYDLRAAPAPEEEGDPPLLFETVIRHPRAGTLCQRRTATIDEAERAHDAACLQAIARGPRAQRWAHHAGAPEAAQRAAAEASADNWTHGSKDNPLNRLRPVPLRRKAGKAPKAAQEAQTAEGPAQEAAPRYTTPEEAAEAGRRARHVAELFAGLQTKDPK